MNASVAEIIHWFYDRRLICNQLPSIDNIIIFEPTIRLFGKSSLLGCRIGAYSYVAPNSNLNRTTVGRYCSIGAGCEIGPTQHPNDWLTTSPIAYMDVFSAGSEFKPGEQHEELTPVSIGNDVWIGSGAAIMGGVRVGDGAIIGYGSVVTRDVPPYCIVGGTPARLIRQRFDDPTIAALQASPWWRYDLVHLRGAPLKWRKPLEALEDVDRRVESGEVDEIPPLWHYIRRSSDNQFSFERHNKLYPLKP